MDTEEYYGGTYPEPPEVETATRKIKVTVTYTIEEELPSSYTEDDIKEMIEDHDIDYLYGDENIDEIEVD